MDYLGPGAEDISPEAAAGILVERLKNAGHLGDRRDALDALLSMSENYPREVGQAGIRIFTDILQAGIADGGMTQTIMEIMLNLVKDRGGGADGGADGGATLESVTAFLMDVQNVQNLLDLLESQDTLTAMTAVQVLQAVQKSAADVLEARILECPAGMQVLVEVLRDPREEVRNQVILLLGQLTTTNLEVKKFVAFQEGFERLFDIMRAEGMLEGGDVIVKDCLDVCLNVLSGSSLTKMVFCQTKCLNSIHQLIDVRTVGEAGRDFDIAAGIPEDDREQGEPGLPAERSASEVAAPYNDPQGAEATTGASWAGVPSSPVMSAMQLEIMSKALDLLLLVLERGEEDGNDNGVGVVETSVAGANGGVGATDSKRAERQSAVASAESGLLSEMLAHVGFSKAQVFCRSPMVCRERAMKVTGSLVDGHANNQYLLGELLVQDVGDGSLALVTLVMNGALGKSGSDPALIKLYNWVLGCFFRGNELGCAQVFSHVIAPPPPPLELDVDIELWVPPTPPGKVLVDTLSSSADVLLSTSPGVERSQAERGRRGSSEAAETPGHAADAIARCCTILSMLYENGRGTTKEIALRVPVDKASASHEGMTLLHAVMRWLELSTSREVSFYNEGAPTEAGAAGATATGRISEKEDWAIADVAISLIRLLCRWVHGCPAAALELLQNPANLFVIEVAAGRCSLLDSAVKSAHGVDTATGAASPHKATFASQCVAVKGLACLVLGILLEFVETEGAATSPGSNGGVVSDGVGRSTDGGPAGRASGNGDLEWSREVVMRVIHKRVGVSHFVVSIEAAKRAFAEVEAAERRRTRAARARRDVVGRNGTKGSNNPGGGGGALRLDLGFTPLLERASEGVRRQVISMFTLGGKDGTEGGEDDEISSGGDAGVAISLKAGKRGAGMASVMQMQEAEIASLKRELSEAVSRVPRGAGGVSALEETLKQKVAELEASKEEQSREVRTLEAKLRDALQLAQEEDETGQRLVSELEGLSVTVSSLERQLIDREADAEVLRRQVEAGGDRSLREKELSRQVEETRARALKAEDELERLQRRQMTEHESAENLRAMLADAEETWAAKVRDLEIALEEARVRAVTNGTSAGFPRVSARSKPDESDEAAREHAGDIAEVLEELRSTSARLSEKNARIEDLEIALAQKKEELEETVRQNILSQKVVEEVTSALEGEREAAAKAEDRAREEMDKLVAVIDDLRSQRDNAVRNLEEASAGGNQQVEALQKELSSVRQREEQTGAEWQRRLDESILTSRDKIARSDRALQQRIGEINSQWELKMRQKEAEWRAEDTRRRAADAQEGTRLREQAARVEALEARCFALEEAASMARTEAEERLREEMDRDRELARAAQKSIAELDIRLSASTAELEQRAAVEEELRRKLDDVQAYLSQSEEEREAAKAREHDAWARVKATEESVRAVETKLDQAAAEIEDRDAIIASVEDARAALEKELVARRDGVTQGGPYEASPRDEALGNEGGGSAPDSGGHKSKDGKIGGSVPQDKPTESPEYLDLLSEHEDLLQLLAQQEVVRRTLVNALKETAGHSAAKTVMASAESAVTNAYGGFVRYVLDKDDEELPRRNGGGNHGDGRYWEEADSPVVVRDKVRVVV